eukprot:TRINITY_DN14606_c0_g2_i1.p2 TRINITY_DN14606_c0_g2~~TRINITY_DN14606_c0_g2_i1.p2  ORF type:complete len:284 (+),score=65.01 TRINITY_DN14606_c0_g2_i1:3752-4603(+)
MSCRFQIATESPPSDSEDSNGEWVPPTMPPPMDDDDNHDNDLKLDPDEEDYLSDEELNENGFITNPFFYQENIPDIEIQIYNPKLPKPGDWPVDHPSFHVPPEIHPDPLSIIDDNEPRRQAPTAKDTSSSSIPVGLKDGQDGSSKKEECLTIKQDIPHKVPVASASNGLSTPAISPSETKDDRQNTLSEDVPVILISDTSSVLDGDHHAEFEQAPDIVPISSSDPFITETHEVITLEDEPIDSGSEPKVMSCHEAASMKEETTTSSVSVDMEDVAKGMTNLLS